jgi:hypothetical protein
MPREELAIRVDRLLAVFVGSILVGCVLAYLSHRWLEQGLSTWVRRRLLAGLARVGLVPARA